MEIVRLLDSTVATCAVRAAEVLRAGGVVLYPTDTLYGLGADALSDKAVAKVYEIKGRKEGKPIHAIVADIEMAAEYSEIPDIVRTLESQLPRGKVTFVCKKKEGIDAGVAKGIQTFGFRIPDNEFCLGLMRAFGKPITATSANRAGEQSDRSSKKILDQLGELGLGIDLVIDAGELPEREPSTVVDFSEEEPRILREGAISVALLRPPSH